MTVSVVIPALNEEKYLPRLLEALAAQTLKPTEIILADAHSTDSTRKIALDFGCQIVDGGLPGEGRNKGASVASSELILFLDSDVWIGRNFIESAASKFQRTQSDIANFWIIPPIHRPLIFIHLLHWNFNQIHDIYRNRPWGSGAAILIKKSVFHDLHGFKESLVMGEDSDLIRRAVAKGYRFTKLFAWFYTSPRRFVRFGLIPVHNAYAGISEVVFDNNISDERKREVTQKALDQIGGWGKW